MATAAISAMWNPYRTLNIDPDTSDFTCIGYASSQGRPCSNRITAANCRAACDLLDSIAATDPRDTNTLGELLEELAPTVLCRTAHQHQADKFVEQWTREIRRLVASRRRPSDSQQRIATHSSIPGFDPYITLYTEPYGFRCVGHSVRENGRCNKPISSRNHDAACNLLDLMAQRSFSMREFRHLFEMLASRALCKRHRWQTEEVVVRWLGLVYDTAPEEEARSATDASPRRQSAEESEENANGSISDGSDDEGSGTPFDFELQSNPDSVSEILPPEDGIALIPPEAPTPPAIPVSSPTTSTPPTPTTPNHATPAVARKEYKREDICSICEERWGETPEPAIVWCQKQCGQNYHRSCMDKWIEERENVQRRTANCGQW
ncbi:hypothetical protein FGG08_007290 [Glutinoglossum americanum]|uniref:RING-type domain-containing protein n=1 Tax=Glutinoglossum americanum TaxID=1670608 RepID=A0A9P8KWL8_9PEZI|nr:hypothetical protein FGG08_007290 [Glutinoglossum americanum]